MSNTYQAVFDAVRISISNGNVGQAVENAIGRQDIESPFRILASDLQYEYTRPSTMYRPTLSLDGDQWCALLGADLMTGVAGFGESPDKAFRAFDSAWVTCTRALDGGR